MEDGGSLLRTASQATDWWDMAVIGGAGEDDNHLAAGYRALANAGVTQWRQAPRRNRAQDWIIVPILNAYRHSIELALKAGIRGAAACIRMSGPEEPDGSLDAVERRLSKTHSLKDLAGQLRALLARLKLDQAGTVGDVLDALHEIDATGQAFRYSNVKEGKGSGLRFVPARPDELAVDFPATAAALDEAAALLIDGLSLMLESYAEVQREIRAHL